MTAFSTPALAVSPGCAAFGSGSAVVPTSGPHIIASGTGFDAGDVIIASIPGPANTVGVELNDTTTNTRLAGGGFTAPPVASFTYTFSAATTNSVLLRAGSSGGPNTATWSCTPAPPPASPTKDTTSSTLLDQMRQTLSPAVAQISSQATSDSVISAITDAFEGGGTTQASAVRIATSFAAIENATTEKDATAGDSHGNAENAFAALGYNKAPITKAPARPLFSPSPWHVWIDARYTGLDDRRLSTFDAHHTNLTGGVSYRFTDALLLGLVTGYEDFSYELGLRNAKLDGNGWNAGGYFGLKLWQGLRLDGMLTWGQIDYGAQFDNVTAGFDADRVTSMLRLSGRYGFMPGWYVEPSARVIYAHESQDAFTDSAGIAHGKYSFDVGLASFGGEVGTPLIWSNWIVTPSVGLYGDYRFGDDTAPTVATLANLDDGWSARVSGQLKWAAMNGFSATLGADYGGLGSDTRYWRARGGLGLKF